MIEIRRIDHVALRVANLDEALKWGARATQACRVPIEVRPFDDEAED